MKKRAEVSSSQMYPYPIEDVFRVIVESIIKQMQAHGKKHNLNFVNPLGKTSDYVVIHGKRELPVHFEITKFERPHRFCYVMEYNNTSTEQEWILEDYDSYTTYVTYTERATNTSFLNRLLLFLNKKQFKRTAFEYFYRIDAVLEENALARDPNAIHHVRITDYRQMSLAHLKKIAALKKINVPPNATKSQILHLLEKRDTRHAPQRKKAS